MNRLIIFLIRKKLHLKIGEKFQFSNQKSKYDFYYFTKDCLMKEMFLSKLGDEKYYYLPKKSSCSLNHLLSDECKINKSVIGVMKNESKKM